MTAAGSSSIRKSPSPSPRSSPLLHFFASSLSPSSSSGGAARGPTSPGDDSAASAATSSGGLIRSLSKCFDGGVSMEEAILSEEEKKTIAKAQGVSGDTDVAAGAPKQWGPSHSFGSDEESKPQNKPGCSGLALNNLIKTSDAASPSKGSQGTSSGKTDPTAPVTTSTGATGDPSPQQQQQQQFFSMKTGMMMAPTTPGGNSNLNSSMATTTHAGTSAAMGGGASSSAAVASFWNNHATPATAGEGQEYAVTAPAGPLRQTSSAAAASSTSTSLSTSALAAANAVLGMLSRAEELLSSSTAGSVAAGREGGLCSPRGSPKESNEIIMEKIPEEATAASKGDCDNICLGFEIEEFGFNAFQAGSSHGHRQQQEYHGNSVCGGEPRHGETNNEAVAEWGMPPSPEPEQPKGYEIRLKSSFSQSRAKRERRKEKQGAAANAPGGRRSPTVMGAFGRTHPNNNAQEPTNHIIQQHQPQPHEGVGGSSRALPDGLPFRELSVPIEIERTVSELTMRSHGALEKHKYAHDSRRMAYYAVGQAANDSDDDGGRSSGGGNRRCYFTGAPIPYGAPFYAGSVQQGPRTLVVFCLPAALGLPKGGKGVLRKGGALASLPDPDDKMLQEMGRRYPGPFETLPAQVRSAHCWRLFVKFCFFSGLPIAEGEMHYRVKGSVRAFPPSPSSQGGSQPKEEEIALSHDVMEAVNGEVSAEILRLPNQNLFDYLRRQYSQQSSKLCEEVFVRSSWEMVRPEV